ncbi:hypothetical protein [Spirilliplanes yamanashiensis]|uniref:Uncharacterized protein n=1 Tax=Spirilliplanes yamanashiensis TaxID=42233 RepID=A0A8J3YE19_9ACTN|nr:hypothetical protein [Spirilliplanes yamanashiensis]MDP9816466.1 hypothetical protein [Spirilliplanes yamanashiensis]GIJ05993.1 hypothetical protein Sya03_53450 [Spirilliplanes yamanashiensis]
MTAPDTAAAAPRTPAPRSAPPPPASPPAVPAARTRRRWHRWLPGALVAVPTVAAVHHYGVGWRDLAAFGAYLVLCLALPGTLVWRAAQRRARTLAEDLAPGLAVGYAIEVLAYLPARAAGVPLAVLAAPVAVVALFAAVRPLRRYWRTDRDAAVPPAGWLWALAGITGFMLLLTCAAFLRTRGPLHGFGDPDPPFHLALIGEARHHLPPQVPWVAGESLDYHWFGYLHLAASSWVTGIEPETLLLRLFYLPLIAALPVALAVAARRVTGRWWPGPVAAAITLFGVAPHPFSWPLTPLYQQRGYGPVDDGGLLREGLWASLTQTYAALVFVPLVIVLTGLLRGRLAGWRPWALLAALVAVMTGAKATYLPILLCGLALVLAVTAVAHRRLHRPALAAAGLTVAGFAFAQAVLLGRGSHGMYPDLVESVRFNGIAVATGLYREPLTGAGATVLTAATLLSWLAAFGGVLALLARRRWADPAHALLAGCGLAGLGAVLVFVHYAHGETWFIVASRPYLALAAAAGLAALVPPGRRAFGVAAAVSAAVGVGVALLVAAIGPERAPTVAADGRRAVLVAVVWPYAALAGGLLLAGLAGWVLTRRVAALRGLAAALLVVAVAAAGLPAAWGFAERNLTAAARDGFAAVDPVPSAMPPGTRRAARWLRAHSSPADLIATNAHCRRGKTCDNLHFWFSAFSERRFLVEGWGFTAKANAMPGRAGGSPILAPFWDPALLAANDVVFRAPDAASVDRLRREFGVRWLLVDEGASPVSPELNRHATLRFRAGRCAVYQL